jgi:hypothetical protein
MAQATKRFPTSPSVHQHEPLRAGKSVDDRIEKPLAPAVKPVKILEERHPRLASAPHLRHPLDHGRELALATLRVHRWGGTLRIGNAEQIEDQGKNLAQALVERRNLPAIFSRAAWSESWSVMAKKLRKSSSLGSSGSALPCGTPCASKIARPRARQRSRNSKQRRLFPTPGSPTMPTT